MSLLRLPLLLIPVVAYNLLLLSSSAASARLASITLPSGARWDIASHDMVLIVGLITLFVELAKSTRTSKVSVVDHGLSVPLFAAALVEFIVVSGAGTTTFFLLVLMTLMDVVAGFTVTITGARRDYGG